MSVPLWMSMLTPPEKLSEIRQGFSTKWQAMTKKKFPLFPSRLSHKGKNKGKYISFHHTRLCMPWKTRKVQEISPQIPICISVCFKNWQLRLELPTLLSLQNPTALPLPCFALLDFVVVTSGENKYSLCSCLFSCWYSKLCDFFLLAPISASIDVSLM